MATTRIRFDKVSVKATRRWKDERGKLRQETKEFFQTVNPWNRNAAGESKSRGEIMEQILAERDAWLKSYEAGKP